MSAPRTVTCAWLQKLQQSTASRATTDSSSWQDEQTGSLLQGAVGCACIGKKYISVQSEVWVPSLGALHEQSAKHTSEVPAGSGHIAPLALKEPRQDMSSHMAWLLQISLALDTALPKGDMSMRHDR